MKNRYKYDCISAPYAGQSLQYSKFFRLSKILTGLWTFLLYKEKIEHNKETKQLKKQKKNSKSIRRNHVASRNSFVSIFALIVQEPPNNYNFFNNSADFHVIIIYTLY